MEYTIQGAEADQADLVIAGALPNQTYASNNGKVSFKMFHAPTRVDINVTNVDKATGMTITVLQWAVYWMEKDPFLMITRSGTF